MPSLSDASPRDWAQMRASARIGTYAAFDALQAGPKPLADLPGDQACKDDMVLADWIVVDAHGMASITERGTRHLRSF